MHGSTGVGSLPPRSRSVSPRGMSCRCRIPSRPCRPGRSPPGPVCRQPGRVRRRRASREGAHRRRCARRGARHGRKWLRWTAGQAEAGRPGATALAGHGLRRALWDQLRGLPRDRRTTRRVPSPQRSRVPRSRAARAGAPRDRRRRARHAPAWFRSRRRRQFDRCADRRAGVGHLRQVGQIGAGRRHRIARVCHGGRGRRARAGRVCDGVRRLPRPGWKRRSQGRRGGRFVVPRPGERSVPAHDGDRRAERPRHAGLARLHAGPAALRGAGLRRRGLARRSAPTGARTRLADERELKPCAPIMNVFPSRVPRDAASSSNSAWLSTPSAPSLWASPSSATSLPPPGGSVAANPGSSWAGWTASLSDRPASPITRTRSACSGTATPPRSRAGCGASTANASRSSRSTVPTLAVPCAGSRSPSSSCAPVTAASTTRTARAPPDRRRAGSSSTSTRSARASSGSAAASFPPSPARCEGHVPLIRSVSQWLEERAGLGAMVRPVMEHQVPRSSASWWYVFGSATLTLFIMQIATGICLALVYLPSADTAYDSLLYLNYVAPLGWFLRAVHFWGSNAMVAVMTLHLIQVFLFGAHKYPREMTWVVGVFLFLCTLGMAFTGQVLRWDQDAYWGLGIAASIAGRSPIIGESVVQILLGGPIIAGRTLTRFFAVHVFIVPGLLIALVGLHLFLVLRLGINEWPMPGRLVDRRTYRQRYEEEVHKDGV